LVAWNRVTRDPAGARIAIQVVARIDRLIDQRRIERRRIRQLVVRPLGWGGRADRGRDGCEHGGTHDFRQMPYQTTWNSGAAATETMQLTIYAVPRRRRP